MDKIFRLGNMQVRGGQCVILTVRNGISVRGTLIDVGGRRMPKVDTTLNPIPCEFRNTDSVTLDVSKGTLGSLQQTIVCAERNKDGNIPKGAAGKPVYLLNGGIRYLSTLAGKPDHMMIPVEMLVGAVAV